MEEGAEANREFAELSKLFLVKELDTKNGRSPEAVARGLLRNRSYVLVLSADGTERGRLEDPRNLEEIIAFMRRHSKPAL